MLSFFVTPTSNYCRRRRRTSHENSRSVRHSSEDRPATGGTVESSGCLPVRRRPACSVSASVAAGRSGGVGFRRANQGKASKLTFYPQQRPHFALATPLILLLRALEFGNSDRWGPLAPLSPLRPRARAELTTLEEVHMDPRTICFGVPTQRAGILTGYCHWGGITKHVASAPDCLNVV